EDLIGSDRVVAVVFPAAAHDIRQPAERADPEGLAEALADFCSELLLTHQHQCVVPQRVDLDGLALARRERDVFALRVHPGKLRVLAALRDETVGVIHADAEARAATVAVNDLATGRLQYFL